MFFYCLLNVIPGIALTKRDILYAIGNRYVARSDFRIWRDRNDEMKSAFDTNLDSSFAYDVTVYR
jgi:hypothetical protein